MRNPAQITILAQLLIALLLFSCGQKEKIIPIGSVKTTRELQPANHRPAPRPTPVGPNTNGGGNPQDLYYISGKYFIDDIIVNRLLDGTDVASDLGNMIADIIVRVRGRFEVVLDPIPLDASDVDLERVKDIRLESINIQIMNSPKKANLKFIKKLNIFVSQAGRRQSDFLLINFNSDDNTDEANSKACDWMCIKMNIKDVNLVNFIQDTREFIIQPVAKIGSIPKERFVIGAYINFKIGLKLPF